MPLLSVKMHKWVPRIFITRKLQLLGWDCLVIALFYFIFLRNEIWTETVGIFQINSVLCLKYLVRQLRKGVLTNRCSKKTSQSQINFTKKKNPSRVCCCEFWDKFYNTLKCLRGWCWHKEIKTAVWRRSSE